MVWGIKDTTGEHQNWFYNTFFETYEEAQDYVDELNKEED